MADRPAPRPTGAGSRQPDDAELKGTLVVSLPLTESSAKVRTGPPKDDDADLALDHWAGVIPMRSVLGEPEASPDLRDRVAVPDHVRDLVAHWGGG